VSINNFIPTIWSAKLLQNLHKQLVFGQDFVINRDYEGDIAAAGDSVRITNIGPVTIGSYSKNTAIGNPEVLDDAQQVLIVDQQKYFNFQIDDVDRAQQVPKIMNEAMREAAYGLANQADQYIASLTLQTVAANTLGTDTSPTTPGPSTISAGYTTAYEYLVDLGVILDQNSVPPDGRFVIVPPWYQGLLLKDNRFVAGYDADQTAARMNGVIGSVTGFSVLMSNNVVQTNLGANPTYNVIAGSNMSWSFANQISQVEAYRPPNYFADAMKGLHLYGAKMVRPYAMALLKCVPPTGLP
jgi:hypothetical protein